MVSHYIHIHTYIHTLYILHGLSLIDYTLHVVWVLVCSMYNYTDIQSASPASSTNSGETLLSAVPATLYECLERY